MTYEQLLWALLHLGLIDPTTYDRETNACQIADQAAEQAKQQAETAYNELPRKQKRSTNTAWIGYQEAINAWNTAYTKAGGVVPPTKENT